jgi:hypothetical protein
MADGSESNGQRKSPARRRMKAGDIARAAADELAELAGGEAERIVGLEPAEDGWCVTLEVVEVRRIPETTDVLGVYEVTMSETGALRGYRRIARHERGRVAEPQ